MTVYVCSCGHQFLFMSLAILCEESHPIGAAATDGTRALAAPVTLRRAG